MNEKTLYLECYSGISGDMTVAALLDLGADQKVLLDGLKSLNVEGYQVKIGRREKSSIDVCDFSVILEQDKENQLSSSNYNPNHDDSYGHEYELEHSHPEDSHSYREQEDSHDHPHTHDEEGLIHEHTNSQIEQEHTYEHTHIYGETVHTHEHPHTHGEPAHTHEHPHTHGEPTYTHEHNHSHSEEGLTHEHTHSYSDHETPLRLGHHEHRNLSDINAIIDGSGITDNAKTLAKKIFHIIAVAEAKAHSKPLDKVHFHEVGAIDSIVDIVSAAICLDNLNIKNVIVSELHEGTGQIKCQHGLLPVPVPAVINIAAEHQLPLHITNVQGELVTPTGAAIVAAIRTSDQLPKNMRILKIGLGAGKRIYSGASGILRAMLIEENTTLPSVDKIWVLEANIDDCTGEALSFTMEQLFKAGAKDVYYTPIFMKKNRPAYLLGVICKEENISEMERIVFTHTTTIGIRKHEAERTILSREQKTVSTSYGDAEVKLCSYENHVYIYPEYESVKKFCQDSGMDYSSAYHLIQCEARKTLL